MPFAGIANLRDSNESVKVLPWQLKELQRCALDPIYFIKNYVYINTKDKGMQLFQLYDFQEELVGKFNDNRFNIVKFPRQCGKSATTRAFILWYALFNEDKVVAILANKLNLAQEQLQQLRDSYINLPYWMQPGVKQWNKRAVQFSHGTRIICSATSPDGIRGMSINLLYLDEFAFVKPHIADDFIASVFPTISSGKTTKVIITSCVTKDTYVFTDKGIQQIGDFIDESHSYGGYEIPEYKVEGYRNTLNTGVLMHNDGIKETRIIKTMYSELECSLEHKFWACKDGEYKIVKTKDLEIGDYVSIKYGMNKWGDDTINFIDKTRPYKKSNRLGSIEYITPNMAYLIGLYISEGNAKKQVGSTYVDITCGDDIREAIEANGLRYTLAPDQLHYRISSTAFVDLLIFLGFDITIKAPQKIIPSRLMKLSKSCTTALLQGIFDGDGWTTKGNYRIGIRSSSKQLISQIRILLLNYGILSTYGEGMSTPNKLVRVHSQYYFTEVTKYEHVKIFFDEIGFKFTRKQCIFETFDTPMRQGDRLDIIPYSVNAIRTFKKVHNIPHTIISFTGEHKSNVHWSRKKMLDIKSKLCATVDTSDSIFDEVSENVIWVPITSITNSVNNVYDFSLNDIEGDKWCHSVIYNGNIGFQTPNGMNHFFNMWEEAREDQDDHNGYVRSEIAWNAVPGRDEEWARDERRKIGEIRFNQEYKCISYNEIIIIINKISGKIETVKIGELYDRLNILTDEYEILTPTGWKPFHGIAMYPPQYGVTLKYNNGKTFNCAKEHMILSNNGWVTAENSLNLDLIQDDGNTTVLVKEIKDNSTPEHYYDILEVDGHAYYSSNIISHNCEFVGSVSTLIDHNFLKTIEYRKPLKIPNIPEYIRIYELPRKREELEAKNWEYIASLDSGYGVHKDSSVLQIFLVKSNITLHQVAVIASNKLEIEEFCKKCFIILQKYGSPNLIIEQNGPGIAALRFFHSTAEYENLLHFDPGGRKMGLWATEKLKQNACILFKTYIQRKFMHIYDKQTIVELHSFGQVTQNKWGGLGGNNDDHITAAYWIPYYLQTPMFYGNIVEVNLKSFKEDNLILSSDDELQEEESVLNNMRDPSFHKEELAKGAEYLENRGDIDPPEEDEDDLPSGLAFRR